MLLGTRNKTNQSKDKLKLYRHDRSERSEYT